MGRAAQVSIQTISRIVEKRKGGPQTQKVKSKRQPWRPVEGNPTKKAKIIRNCERIGQVIARESAKWIGGR